MILAGATSDLLSQLSVLQDSTPDAPYYTVPLQNYTLVFADSHITFQLM